MMVNKDDQKSLIDIGAYFRDRRKSLGLTQPQVAEAVGLSVYGYQLIEYGQTSASLTNIVKICKFLKIKLEMNIEGGV